MDWIQMLPDIIPELISAAGVIVAASIGAKQLGKEIHKKMDSESFSYSEDPNNLKELLRSANSDITIVVTHGKHLLDAYEQEIRRCLAGGVTVRYLMLDPKSAAKFNNELNKENERKVNDDTKKVIEKLKELKEKYGDIIKIKTINKQLCASYICVDAWNHNQSKPDNAIIRVMVYQHYTHSENSPILHLRPKANTATFDTTMRSVQLLWNDGENDDDN